MSPQNEAIADRYVQMLQPLDTEVKLRIISMLSFSMIGSNQDTAEVSDPWQGLSAWAKNGESYEETVDIIHKGRVQDFTRKIEDL